MSPWGDGAGGPDGPQFKRGGAPPLPDWKRELVNNRDAQYRKDISVAAQPDEPALEAERRYPVEVAQLPQVFGCVPQLLFWSHLCPVKIQRVAIHAALQGLEYFNAIR